MRMWMINPLILCKKHLLGEHVEHHMFIGCLYKQINLSGYFKNNLFEPKKIIERHNSLVKEMNNRGIVHRTPIIQSELVLEHLTEEEYNYIIDRRSALEDLLTRCSECALNFKNLILTHPHNKNIWKEWDE